MKRITKLLASLFLIVSLLSGMCTPVLASHVTGDGRHTIMGSNSVTIGQMINYFQDNATYPTYYMYSDAPTIYDFCRIYYDECEAEGVDVEVAFSQAMLETGFLRFGGNVSISQYNFGGIGARPGIAGQSYYCVRDGVRAQVQRLKIYATNIPLSQFANAPATGVETDYNGRLSGVRGNNPYVENLNTWGGSASYYQAVLNAMARLESASSFTTWYNGVNYAAVYDPYYYIEVNRDVRMAYGNDGEAVIRHFVNYGMREARLSSRYFDVRSYKNQYPDLRLAYGYDWKSYYMHYVKWGQSEGRKASGCPTLQGYVTILDGKSYAAVYDYNYYINHNGDVRAAFGDDDIAVLKHFVNYGMREGRLSSASFDVRSYKNRYGDLRLAYGNSWESYYMHYINWGSREGRQTTGCPTIAYGITYMNGVDYSAVYDYRYYVAHNRDVANAYGDDDIAVLNHFIKYGMNEGRLSKATFNVYNYKARYGDLRNAYGNNIGQYYMHYVKWGQREGRNAS